MNKIKENGYVRWRGFFTTMGGVLLAMFLYLDSKMVSKAAFEQFEKRVIASLAEIKFDLRNNDKK